MSWHLLHDLPYWSRRLSISRVLCALCGSPGGSVEVQQDQVAEEPQSHMRRSKSSLSLLNLLLVTTFTTALATGKPQVPFQLCGPISSTVDVYFYPQYIQQPWDAVVLDQLNTKMGNMLQIKYLTQREQQGQVDGV